MKKIIIHIKPEDVHTRNLMHFQVQLNNRMQITKNKKAYDRKKNKKTIRKELVEYKGV